MAHHNIPLLDLKTQYTQLKPQIDQAIERVLDSQNFILGPEVAAFEQEIAAYTQSEYAVGVSSGSDALILALMALEIGPGDEVITSPYTFFATVGAISRVGATPVFVDIEAQSYNLNPHLLEAAITSKTKAIIPVHLFGQCADMQPINQVAQQHQLKVIEDAAQAIGSYYQGQAAGSMSDIACFSCFPAKNLGAYGDAGFITCQDPILAEKMKILRAHGSQPKYYHQYIGGNFRLDAIQAAILREKLPHLDSWAKQRQANAQFYDASLQINSFLETPWLRSGDVHVYNQYMLKVDQNVRPTLLEALKSQGIATALYYPLPLHLQDCFESLGYQQGDFPVAEQCALESFAIPVFPELGEERLNYIVAAIKNFKQA